MSLPCVVLAEDNSALRELWLGQLREAGFAAARHREPIHAGVASVFIAGSGCSQELLLRLRALEVPVIFVAHSSSEQLAIDALRAGCAEYLRMPLRAAELIDAVKRFSPAVTRAPADGMIGESAAMQDLRVQIKRVARVRSNVLITGETGTGKELVAQSIHRQSENSSRKMVCINCAAIPDALVESELFGYERGAFTGAAASHLGKLEAAEAGTIFLDEIGDMSLTAQAKILRAIEAKELYRLGGHVPIAVNVRVLAATHRNLEEMAETGQFRRDLLFRLSVARVHLVPLRERREDIRIIARNTMEELNRELDTHVEDLSEELWQRLMDYSWPGNIRELRNMLESFLVQAPARTIAVEDLSAELLARLTAHRRPDERERLLTALMETRWNKSKAAEKLHWSRMTLYRKMTKYSFHSSAHPD